MTAVVDGRPKPDPGELEERILRYLAGDLDPIELEDFQQELAADSNLSAHVAEREAEYYDRQVETYGLVAFLQGPDPHDECYSLDTLARYVRGELKPVHVEQVQAHLICPLCGPTVESLGADPRSSDSGSKAAKLEREHEAEGPKQPSPAAAEADLVAWAAPASAARQLESGRATFRPWVASTALIGAASVAVALLLYPPLHTGSGPYQDPPNGDRLMARLEARFKRPTRSFEGRLTLPVADLHRPYDTHLGDETLDEDRLAIRLMADLDRAGAHRAVAAMYLAAGQTRLALAALDREPPTAEALSDKAAVLLAAQDPEGALRFANEALALEPSLVQARWNRAVALQRLGRRDASRQLFESLAEQEGGAWAEEAARRATVR